MKVVGDISKTDELSQIGVIADNDFKAGEFEFKDDIAIGRTKEDKLITVCVRRDKNWNLIYFNVVETKL